MCTCVRITTWARRYTSAGPTLYIIIICDRADSARRTTKPVGPDVSERSPPCPGARALNGPDVIPAGHRGHRGTGSRPMADRRRRRRTTRDRPDGRTAGHLYRGSEATADSSKARHDRGIPSPGRGRDFLSKIKRRHIRDWVKKKKKNP